MGWLSTKGAFPLGLISESESTHMRQDALYAMRRTHFLLPILVGVLILWVWRTADSQSFSVGNEQSRQVLLLFLKLVRLTSTERTRWKKKLGSKYFFFVFKYMLLFQISSKHWPIQSIYIFKMNYILDSIFSSIIQDVN